MTEQPTTEALQAAPADPNADCPHCLKPQALCVCAGITPIDNKVSLLILQHPQEQDRELGTARLTTLHLKDALLKIGLSWPSLTKILGRATDPQRWAILYLGSVKAAALSTRSRYCGGQPERQRGRSSGCGVARDRRHHPA